ncbi:MAG: anti-sigma factor [Arachnia sp.]
MPDIYESSLEEVVERFRRASHNPPEWSEPSAGLWDSITSELGLGLTPPPGVNESSLRPTSGDNDGRAEATTNRSGIGRRALLTGLGGLVVGASLGAGAATLITRNDDTPPAAIKSAVLTPLERADEQLGVAKLRPLDVGYSLAVDVPAGAEHPGGYVEVWLINVDLTRMVSVGVFAAGSSAQFYVSDELIDSGYLVVDLSNEEFDEEPRHSGDTIMRGELLA